MGRFRKWWYGYQAVAFVALIPIMGHFVIANRLPKIILLVVTPIYVLLAWSSYKVYQNSR